MNLYDLFKNSKGQVFYGMHFYPGVAQYDSDQGSYRVFVNEATIRKLNPTFAGRPVFVEHVDGVDDDVNELRADADGWVVESFYNEADGKTWVKFLLVSDRAFAAVKAGYRLSNAYIPDLTDAHDKTWNGVDYQKTVVGGEFEHLAIVQNPRYEESVIMTPDQFKAYNVKLKADLVRFANSKDKKGDTTMGLKLFKREKIANAVDIENTMVELPKSKKEMSISQLVNDHDAILNMNGYANGDHMVKVNDKDEMSVNDLVKAYQSKCANEEDEEDMENADDEDGGEPGGGEEDDIDPERAENEEEISMGGDGERDDNGDVSLDNVEDDDDGAVREMGAKSPLKKKESQKNALLKKKKLANAKIRAQRLRNAHKNSMRDDREMVRVDLAEDQVARGQDRYGSAKK